ncbi:MAG: DNA cytosine methyltransferase, partial [Planctomycetota bacterium]
EVLRDLSHLGFAARWEVISAADVGAPHLRERAWILAHAAGKRREAGISEEAASAVVPEPQRTTVWDLGDNPQDIEGRKAPSGIPLLAHGMANSVDRLAASGDGQVPRVVEEAWSRLTRSVVGGVD